MRVRQFFGEPASEPAPSVEEPRSETRTLGVDRRPTPQAPPIQGGEKGDVLLPAVRVGVDEIAEDIRSLTTTAAVALTSTAEAHQLSELRAKGRKALRQLEEWQKKALEPVKERDREIRACFKPLVTALEAFEERAKKTALVWQKEENDRIERERRARQKAQEEAARKQAEAEAAGDEAAAAEASHALAVAEVAEPVVVPTRLVGDSGTSYITKRWTFEIVNEDMVPREFCSSDSKKLRAAVAGGARQIAGVNIYEDEDMRVRLRS